MVEGIRERLMNIVVDSTLVVEARWLPELADVVASVIVVEHELR